MFALLSVLGPPKLAEGRRPRRAWRGGAVSFTVRPFGFLPALAAVREPEVAGPTVIKHLPTGDLTEGINRKCASRVR